MEAPHQIDSLASNEVDLVISMKPAQTALGSRRKEEMDPGPRRKGWFSPGTKDSFFVV